ncbi:Lrp/AsnC family transcriptional regulator [Streptomyces himalayensis]|uniref:Lrp/AsnC family transcriptional regulator n=1 Tax=Streptomyces himalayensis subsp. himalayensis TaxID=2756131 RepID=A0A7W0DLC4_9ACTN|nr:Lrp/AsnC family transcriptional regulator [Streptomyces himalayensis]MBA2946738.1 Lrp/AsnC family transcriptional regulator [Streptomyces himalayensis subsp. himalayensis]
METSSQSETRSPKDSKAPGGLLDAVDRQLVELLVADGRAGYAELGARVELSGDAVRERLKRLIADDVIKVVGSVSPATVGLDSFALVGITVSGPALPVARALAELPEADLVVQTTGMFDIIIELVCRDDREMLQVLDESVRSVLGVHTCMAMHYLSVEKYAPEGSQQLLVGGGRPGNSAGPDARGDFDDADRALVAVLQQDGRASFKELAEQSGVPYASARRRVLRLLERGEVRIVTITNQLLYGRRVQAGVGLRVQGPIPDVVQYLSDIDEVEVVAATTGPYDLLLEVSCASRADLYRLTGTVLRQISGITSTETFSYIDVHKLPYTWTAL